MSLKPIGGYAGKLLRVDLTEETFTEERLDEKTLRKYVGGAGFGAMFLYAEVSPDIDWSEPENRLIFATGPLAATQIPGSGTWSVSTKGTLTGGAAFGQANGFFGAFLKRSGFDGIIVQGRAKRLVYLYIHDGTAEFKDAEHLSGCDTFETDDLIKEELGFPGRAMSVIGIGPAGENLVKFAAVVGDKGHVAGHNGIGAVMGSKKLKAIAVARGKAEVSINDPKRVAETAKKIFETVKSDRMGQTLYRYGTLGTYGIVEKVGALPIKNYTTNIYPDKEKLHQFTPEYIRERFQPKPNPCWACRMHHCHESTITQGPYEGQSVEEPEFECMSAMGSQIGNMEVASAMMLINDVDRLGLEINETGWVIGLAMECYEKGLITQDDTNGIEMTWGHVEGVRSMLQDIAQRKDFGAILAEGAMRASQRIGGEAPNFAVHTMKGNTPRGYDHRAFWTEMFDKITSNTGTLESRPTSRLWAGEMASPEEVVSAATSGKGRMSFVDTLGVCFFSTIGNVELLAAALSAVTGWNVDSEEAEAVGLRIVTLARVYNLRAGHTRAHDAPSPRYGSAPIDGPFAGQSMMPVLDEMLDIYYRKMGWDVETGKPLPETLTCLGLEYTIKDIW
jgi:aldehyde:ferredoxin oxidoreductase